MSSQTRMAFSYEGYSPWALPRSTFLTVILSVRRIHKLVEQALDREMHDAIWTPVWPMGRFSSGQALGVVSLQTANTDKNTNQVT